MGLKGKGEGRLGGRTTLPAPLANHKILKEEAQKCLLLQEVLPPISLLASMAPSSVPASSLSRATKSDTLGPSLVLGYYLISQIEGVTWGTSGLERLRSLQSGRVLASVDGVAARGDARVWAPRSTQAS